MILNNSYLIQVTISLRQENVLCAPLAVSFRKWLWLRQAATVSIQHEKVLSSDFLSTDFAVFKISTTVK